MERPEEIRINQLQLDKLLDEKQKYFFDKILLENVFCKNCKGTCTQGIKISEMFISTLNDIVVKGICNICGGKVARVMEFGEDPAFYARVTEYRKTLKN